MIMEKVTAKIIFNEYCQKNLEQKPGSENNQRKVCLARRPCLESRLHLEMMSAVFLHFKEMTGILISTAVPAVCLFFGKMTAISL